MQLVILGRDGVINEIPEGGVVSLEAWRPLPGSLQAIARLTFARFHIVVVTNQPGVAEGRLDSSTLARIHARMTAEVAREGGRIEAVLYCPHGRDEGCACRKPRPGLLQELAGRLDVDLSGVPVIGDALSDLRAARAVGARPILVRTGGGRAVEEAGGVDLEGVEVHDDLAAAAAALIGEAGE